MHKNLRIFFLFSILVTGLIINPSTFSVDGNSKSFNLLNFVFAQETNSTSNNTTNDTTNSTSNNTTNDDAENVHEQLTAFVQQSRTLFEEQKAETRAVIKECLSSLLASEPSQRDDIRKQCRANLDDIRESYKQTRDIYRESFKEFRKSIDVAIRESKGLNVNPSEKLAALSDIKSNLKSHADSEKIKELRKSISDELKEEKKQFHEDMKKERKQMREDRKHERDAAKEQKQTERDAAKEQKQTERDAAKEQKRKEMEKEKNTK